MENQSFICRLYISFGNHGFSIFYVSFLTVCIFHYTTIIHVSAPINSPHGELTFHPALVGRCFIMVYIMVYQVYPKKSTRFHSYPLVLMIFPRYDAPILADSFLSF